MALILLEAVSAQETESWPAVLLCSREGLPPQLKVQEQVGVLGSGQPCPAR